MISEDAAVLLNVHRAEAHVVVIKVVMVNVAVVVEGILTQFQLQRAGGESSQGTKRRRCQCQCLGGTTTTATTNTVIIIYVMLGRRRGATQGRTNSTAETATAATAIIRGGPRQEFEVAGDARAPEAAGKLVAAFGFQRRVRTRLRTRCALRVGT